MFQFHEGPIKTASTLAARTRMWCFNSMKVRLKPHLISPLPPIHTLFQFHEGPIKTFAISRNALNTSVFQFHEGPIKTFLAQALNAEFIDVSIP